MLGGCGKDKPAKTKTANIEKAIAKIDTRKVDNAEAEKALSALSLNESGSGALSWASRDGKAGNYTYSDVTVDGDDEADIKISQVKLFGAHMDGEQASFDKIELNGFTVATEKDDGDVSFGNISLVKPSPALSAGIAKMLSGDEDAFDDMEGDISFQAASFSDMKIKSEDGNFSIKNMALGTAKDKTGMFTLSDLKMDIKDDKDDIKMSLGSIEVTGANMEKYKGFFTEAMNGGGDEEAIAKIMQSMNPYDPDFSTISLKDFDMNIEGLAATLKSYSAQASKKNGVVTISQKMSPLSIIPPKDSKDKDMKEFAEVLSTMGYDRLEFTMGGKSVLDEKADNMKTHDTYIELRDGFRFSYDFDIDGYKDFSEKAAAMQANGNGSNPMAAIGMASALKFNHLRLAFRDDSFIDRAFKLAAEKEDTTADALKQKFKDSLGQAGMMAQDEGQQKLADDLNTALTSLIDNGGTFVIELNPTTPVNFGSVAMGAMMGGNVDIAALGLSISTQ